MAIFASPAAFLDSPDPGRKTRGRAETMDEVLPCAFREAEGKARLLVALAVEAIDKARDLLDDAVGIIAAEENRQATLSPIHLTCDRWLERASELEEIADGLS